MSDFISQDIWPQIFKKSTSETLIRCRCVCKAWRSLISSPSFVAAHLAVQKPHLILRQSTNSQQIGPEEFILMRSETLTCFNLSFGAHSIPNLYTIGTVNGVICLAGEDPGTTCTVALWNPMIRKLLHLPSPLHFFAPMPAKYFSIFGFGFDPAKNDLKIVRIIWELRPRGFRCSTWFPLKRAQVFSVQDWEWKAVDLGCNLECYSFNNQFTQCLSNGAAHWAGFFKGRRNVALLSFHFEKEELKIFDLPQEVMARKEMSHAHVCKLGSLLSVLEYKGSRGCDIWAMKEYGDVTSWCKMVSLSWELGGFKSVLWVRGDGGEIVVLSEEQELVSYDSRNPYGRLLGVSCKSDGYFADDFVASLILLDIDEFGRRRMVD